MNPHARRIDRRSWLGLAGAGLALGGFDVIPVPRRRSDLDPVDLAMAWILETGRDRVLERAASELRKGLPPRSLLDAIHLAAVEEVRPQPVGFKFHAVMVARPVAVVMDLRPAAEALVPLLWYLDEFKASQARDAEEGEWKLGPAPREGLPPEGQALARLRAALEDWDTEAADAAVTVAAKASPLPDVFDVLFEYGMRCFRNIGHKPIATAMAWHGVQRLGRHRALPVLRSLVAAQLEGGRTALADGFEDQRTAAAGASPDDPPAEGGRRAPGADDLLPVLRSASGPEASQAFLAALRKGAETAALWDVIASAAAELVIQRPDIVALHALTAVNAFRTAALRTSRDHVRKLALLQASAWVTEYRRRLFRNGPLPDDALRIDDPLPARPAIAAADFREVLAAADGDRSEAVVLAGAAAAGPGMDRLAGSIPALLAAAGTDVHEYKFGVAVLEEWERAGPAARRHLLGAAAQHLPDPRREPGILAGIRTLLRGG